MILRICLGVFFLLFGLCAKGQIVYATDWEIEADIKVYVTKDSSKAHLFVFLSKNKLEADDAPGIWFYTDKAFEAKRKIYFTRKPEDADMIIYYTKDKTKAGFTPAHTNHQS